MNGVQWLVLISVIVGIILVMISLISIIRRSGSNTGVKRYFEVDNTIKAIDRSIEEADKAIEELSQFSNKVLEEIDNKYQELLFLYNLLDEKKKDVYEVYRTSHPVKNTDTLQVNSRKKPTVTRNPKLTEILQMNEQGISIPDIAKAMNMGQGEIKLMIEMYKDTE